MACSYRIYVTLRDHVRSVYILQFAGSSNGRIAVSETVHLGSNPSPAASLRGAQGVSVP